MLTGRDIIFISSIEWDFLWQLHQEIAVRFARAGNRVLYIENTGVRAPGLKDSSRVLRRLKRWTRSSLSQGVREVSPDVFVVSPLAMPPFGSATARAINRRMLIPAIKRIVRRLGFREPILWTYLPTETAVDLVEAISTPGSLVTYYCGADFGLLAPDAARCRRSENELLRLADLVLTTCPELVARCTLHNDNVQLVPAMVNLDAFPAATSGAAASNGNGIGVSKSQTEMFSRLPRPVIGYVGGLHRFVDYDLLFEMVRRRPEWSWVFVGAITADIGRLDSFGNVQMLGQQPHDRLAEFINRFDVCAVPYVNTLSTATVVPMKVNEYLAMGKPVVSTDLPTVCDFNHRHQILTTSPNEPESFLRAIEEALSLPTDAATRQRRREVAALGDCAVVLERISGWIEHKMTAKTGTTDPIAGQSLHPTA